jgi:inward rectifier potassium channel
MTVSWPVFFGSAAVLFAALNAVFGFLYSLGHDPIANAGQNGPLAYFYFSIETLATVGYGDMHPQTNYGHLIATIEIFTGMSFLAVMTGLIFARFSRPRARFEFANKAVITNHEGRRTLMIRMANVRHNAISRANARLWLIRVERTKEGEQFRRFYELKLDRSDHPIFALSWTLFHVIDTDSPLHGLTVPDLADADALLVLNVSGLDDTSAQQLHARRTYSGAISAGIIVIRTSLAFRRRGVCCSTTLNSTTRCQSSRAVRTSRAQEPFFVWLGFKCREEDDEEGKEGDAEIEEKGERVKYQGDRRDTPPPSRFLRKVIRDISLIPETETAYGKGLLDWTYRCEKRGGLQALRSGQSRNF